MESFLNKLSDYLVIQTIIPGALIAYISSVLLSVDFLPHNPLYDFFVVFILGLIASRIGSLIIEPLYKKFNFISFRKHSLFIDAEKKDNKITKLLESNNLYCSIIGSLLFLMAEKVFLCLLGRYSWLQKNSFCFITLFLVVLYSVSYKKQSGYIVSRIDKAIEEKDKK